MAQYAITDHEYSLNNGSTWTTCTSGMDNGNGTGTIPVGDVAIPVGYLQVRVKASGNRPAGNILSNSVAFTLATGGAAPTITSFSPTSGQVGSALTITGTNFTGATAVTVGGVAATFTPISATEINATIPAGAVTGKVAVTTPDGTAQSTGDYTVTTGASEYKLIIDGNSHFASNNLETYVTALLPDYMTAHSVSGSFTSVVNFAVAGQSTLDMAADAATQIDPAFDAAKTKNVLIVCEATNHIYTNQATGQQAYDAIKSYCQARKTANPTIANVVWTAMPRSNSGTPAGYEAARVAFNDLLRAAKAANETWLDAIADIAADERFRDDGDELNTTYFSSDQVHLNDTGRAAIAPIIARAILTAGFGTVFTDYEKAVQTTISSTKITQTGEVLTANNTAGGYGHTGIFQYKIPANQDGGFIMKINDVTVDKDAIIGFANSNAATPYASAGMIAAVWNSAGTVYAVNSGSTGSSGATVSNNSLLKLYRTSGVWNLTKSTDNGVTWSASLYSHTDTANAELFLVADLNTNATARGIRVLGMEESAPSAQGIIWADGTPLTISGTSTGADEVDQTGTTLTAAAGAGAGYSAKETFGMKLPANTPGWVGYIVDTAQGDGIIGFLPTNVAAGYQAMIAGTYNSTSNAQKVEGGNVSTVGGIGNGDVLIISRDASGQFTIYGGPENALAQIGTVFTAVNAGEIFTGCNIYKTGKISNPRGSGLVPA